MNLQEIPDAVVMAARQELARRYMVNFVQETTPRWKPGPIHHEICHQFDRIARKEVDRLMLLCPPQHGKSTVASKRAAAYLLGKDPTLDIISASATHPLAEEFGGEVRNCVGSPEFAGIFNTVSLSADTQAKGRWRTSKGGGYYAVGIGGALFGRGAGLGIVDDPFSTWEDAQSETQRAKVWGWYQGTFYNRIRPGGAIIIIQHRMHEDDLVGKLLEQQEKGGDKWEVVNLPATIENPPWPERYDSAALLRIKQNTDPRHWSALYMQDPTPEDGTFFMKEWFKEWKELPDVRYYGTSDYAVTDGGGDYTVHRIWGVSSNGDLYRVDGWRGQTTPDVWIERKLDLVHKYKPMAWFGESGVIRRAIEPMLKRRMVERGIYFRMEWVASISDKSTRARGFQSRAASGRVYFEPNADISEHLKFPAGKHDDDVDCSSLIGIALDEAHPAVIPPAKDAKKQGDSWDRAFNRDEEEEDNWKLS